MLFIKRTVLCGIIAHVEPQIEECCGFFFGNQGLQDRTITKLMKVSNSKEDDRVSSFAITPNDYLHAELVAVQENLTLLGVYHSHPNCPAVPSEYDRVAAQPNFSYLIISVMNSKITGIRSWQLDNNLQFKEVKIHLE